MKTILIHVVSSEEINFYRRFNSAFYELNYSIIYTTTSLYCYFILRKARANVKLVYIDKDVSFNENESSKSFFNFLVGWSSNNQAFDSYLSSYNCAVKILKEKDVYACFIPSGRLASQEGVLKACKDYNVATIFSGYGNFPGKTFFDKLGTDKNSSLFKDKSFLNDLEYDDIYFNEWKQDFIKSKLEFHNVPQVRRVNLNLYASRFFRILFCKVEKKINVAIDIDRKWGSLLEFKKFDYKKIETNIDDLPKEFIFMPLQYTKDAQLILNYDKDLISSINDALSICREKNITLVIKPHPVENSIDAFDKIQEIVNENDDLMLCNSNTFRLIELSSEVITVNSTAGLESMLMQKNVTFLGDSFYSDMTKNEMGSYLMAFLIDIDYFDCSQISKETVLNIFSICKVD
ncbi:capsular polysaccharide export protein, LipB/KpsS family [Aliivibrio fischeri]|nr:hypothetical protein [Aliivibrio fischeri]